MWFKNFFIYRLPAPWNTPPEDLELSLKSYAHQSPSALEMKTMGFTPPFLSEEESPFLFSLDHFYLMALTIESRILPNAVINQNLEERLKKLKEEKGFLPGRRERLELKTAVTEELMPRAFLNSKKVLAWVDHQNGFLLINVASPNGADAMVECLNNAIPRFPLKNVHTQQSPQSVMMEALLNPENLGDFALARYCVLESENENKENVRYANHSLEGEMIQKEIQSHLRQGKTPKALGFYFENRFSFVLTEKMQVKNLRLEEDLFKERDEALSSAEDEKMRFQADFLLMSAELSRFLPRFIEFLGGEKNAPSL